MGLTVGGGSTRYDKIREDGWYRVSRSIPDQTGADVYYFAEVADGVSNLKYEAPQVETFNTSIAEPTAPILTGASGSQRRRKHLFEVDGDYNLPEHGWMGCCVIPYTDAAALVAGPSPGLIQGDILTWFIDATNRCRIIWSDTSDTIKFLMEQGGVTQADLEIPQAKVLQGVPLGIVVSWGSLNGDRYVKLVVNGIQEDIVDTANTPPTGIGTVYIGANHTGGNVANIMIHAAATGQGNITRDQMFVLSRWFQEQSFSTLGLAGE